MKIIKCKANKVCICTAFVDPPYNQFSTKYYKLFLSSALLTAVPCDLLPGQLSNGQSAVSRLCSLWKAQLLSQQPTSHKKGGHQGVFSEEGAGS